MPLLNVFFPSCTLEQISASYNCKFQTYLLLYFVWDTTQLSKWLVQWYGGGISNFQTTPSTELLSCALFKQGCPLRPSLSHWLDRTWSADGGGLRRGRGRSGQGRRQRFRIRRHRRINGITTFPLGELTGVHLAPQHDGHCCCYNRQKGAVHTEPGAHKSWATFLHSVSHNHFC